MKCPFCLERIKTEIVMKPEFVTLMFGLAVFALIPNAIMIVIVVVALQLTASKKHRCSLCERELGSDGKFLLIFSDEVYSFSLGENGVLVSKKMMISFGLIVFAIVSLWIRNNIEEMHDWTNITWE